MSRLRRKDCLFTPCLLCFILRVRAEESVVPVRSADYACAWSSIPTLQQVEVAATPGTGKVSRHTSYQSSRTCPNTMGWRAWTDDVLCVWVGAGAHDGPAVAADAQLPGRGIGVAPREQWPSLRSPTGKTPIEHRSFILTNRASSALAKPVTPSASALSLRPSDLSARSVVSSLF
jgi:hypothetical protein